MKPDKEYMMLRDDMEGLNLEIMDQALYLAQQSAEYQSIKSEIETLISPKLSNEHTALIMSLFMRMEGITNEATFRHGMRYMAATFAYAGLFDDDTVRAGTTQTTEE